MSYDARGRRRNPTSWNYTGMPDSTTYLINRGYTFHEHYDKLGLINMNRPKGAHDNTAKINHRVGVTFGRVYDPIVGRFLSVDPLVGNPLSAQDYNGYSYCVNNPLKYTDPSGYTYWKHEGDGEWSHFEYHPFQNGSANFREASNGGVAYYGAPMTYRYAAGQYRDEKGNVVQFKQVKTNYVERVAGRYVLTDNFSKTSIDGGKTWGNVVYIGSSWKYEKPQAVTSNEPSGQGDNPNRYVLFPNSAMAEAYINKNAEIYGKEIFFYMLTCGKILVGPWSDAYVDERGKRRTSPRYAERYQVDGTVLFKGKYKDEYYKVLYFVHLHFNGKDTSEDDKDVFDYFRNNGDIQSLIYFGGKYY